ncbi:peptidoglycan binding domain-containing protein [Streptomyces sp. NPDC047023]|uniref:peptidoglycan binding domain-containing protein n=1 Tax=Streptomyces sp. NPDC047023 TaxID=3155139 RepID=UPI0033E2B6D1
MTSKPSTPESDGPKTETTLTTRIRINIPGSRPIPPVVVRKAMGTNSGSSDTGGQEPAPQQDAAPAPETKPALPPRPQPTRIQAAPEPEGAPGAEGEQPAANNWFAPRKQPAPTPPPSAAPAQMPEAAAAPPPLARRVPGVTPTPGPAPQAGPAAGFPPPARPQAPQAPQPQAQAPDAAYAPPRTPPPPVADFGTGYAQPPAPAAGGPGVGSTQGFPAYGNDGTDTGPVTEAFPAFGSQDPGPAGPTGGPGFGSGAVGAPAAPAAPDAWPGPDLDGPLATPVPAPAPAAPRPAPAQPKAEAKPAKKKGRSKLVLVGGGIIALIGVAYGAGLLLNHSDVPKGTTVLGVDIGGSRDEAVSKLQIAFGTRAAAPIQVGVGGKQVELKPEKAGLSLDGPTTVRNAAGSDYNPVTVIGSLLGNERVADPVLPVDEEKLRDALEELAGTSGSVTEATITFDTGKAVAVPGKAGTTLDVDASVDLVTRAFRDQVATGKPGVAELPTAAKEPSVGQAELDRAMKEFAEPAMSANATVKAGGKSIAFGKLSLPKFLSMQAVDGRLTEKFDLDALKAAYGSTFDGVQITRGTGAKTAVTPQDVAGALGKALRGKTAAERTVVIDTDAN